MCVCLTGVYVHGITCIPFCNGARPSSAVESDCVMSPCVFTLYLSTSLSLRTSEVRLRERGEGEREREKEREGEREREREGERERGMEGEIEVNVLFSLTIYYQFHPKHCQRVHQNQVN